MKFFVHALLFSLFLISSYPIFSAHGELAYDEGRSYSSMTIIDQDEMLKGLRDYASSLLFDDPGSQKLKAEASGLDDLLLLDIN